MILKVQIILFLIVISSTSEVKTTVCTKRMRDGLVVGYRRVGNKCIPLCRNGCPNGSCVGPIFCRCAKGFAKYGGPYSACEPIPTTPQTSTLRTTFETTSMTTSTPSCFDLCYNGIME